MAADSLHVSTDSDLPTPLFTITWDEDRQFRMDPHVVTSLLCEQVPVLDFVRWQVTEIEPGWTKSVLPLNPQSTNQHFTHQAALFLLAGDYTGGTALASLLRGWPVVGVHPVTSPSSVAMWLLRAEMKYMRPSVGDLTVTALIEPDAHERISKRFLSGKTVIESITIQYRNGEELVGEGVLTYFARQSEMLRATGISADKVNALFELKLTSSAELIAGVRAIQHGHLIQDPFAEHMAGQHGMALAKRFCERTPQLGGMVAARTLHLDHALMNFVNSGGRNIVIVGVGWDMRPFRLPLPEGTNIFELDFPTTLAARRNRLDELHVHESPGISRCNIPIDVRTMPLAPALAEHLNFDEPVFIAWEGMNMYFQEEEVRSVLKGMLPVLRNPNSLLWVDLVDREAVMHPEKYPESVQNFMRGMQILGEPFTFGPESPADLMESAGLRGLEVVPSDACLRGKKDPVFSVYKFCIAAARSANGDVPTTFRKTRIDKRNRAVQPHSSKADKRQSPHSHHATPKSRRSSKLPK